MKNRDFVLKEFIKKYIDKKIINEVEIEETEPAYIKEYPSSNGVQYIFNTKNDNYYQLSLTRTKIFTTNKTVIETYNDKVGGLEEDNFMPFIAINFTTAQQNPNEKDAYTLTTGVGDMYDILSKILWILNKYFISNENDKAYLFSADRRRMRLYSNLFKELENRFIIFPPEKYDHSYAHDLCLMIKK